MNAADILLRNGADSAPALISAEETLTYAQLRDQVARAAGLLVKEGMKPNDRLIVAAEDSTDWVIAFLSAIWLGGVPVALNLKIPFHEVAESIHQIKPFGWFLGSNRQPLGMGDLSVFCGKEWRDRVAGTAPSKCVKRADDDAAFWVFTSGTTGGPKAIIHAQRSVLAIDAFAREVLQIDASDRLYATSKLFFAYALANALFAGLKVGASIVLDAEWPNAQRVRENLGVFNPTVLFSVPTLYRQLINEGAAAQWPANLRHCIAAGEWLAPSLAQDWREATGEKLINGYGMSETMALVMYGDGEIGEMQAAPGARVAVVGTTEDGAQKLAFASSSLALGYHNQPSLQTKLFVDGMFRPSDLFQVAQPERWRFIGREDDQVKVSGRWVSLIELEQRVRLLAGKAVSEVAFAAREGDDGLMGLVAFAVASGNAELAQQRIEAAIAQLSTHQRPEGVMIVNELPRTSSGKLKRSALVDLLSR